MYVLGMKIKNKKKKNKKAICFFSVFVAGWFMVSQVSFGEMNIFKDKDQDGLSDEEEIVYGTNKNNSDTDGDGYSDGEEVRGGYDPLKPAPGDKILEEKIPPEFENEGRGGDGGYNYTDEFISLLQEEKGGEIEKITQALNGSDEDLIDVLNNSSLTTGDITSVLSQVTSQGDIMEEVEILPQEDFNILEKPEGTEDEVKDEERGQIQSYLSVLSYILFNNAPTEITQSISEDQLDQVGLSFVNQLTGYIDAGNEKELKSLRNKSENAYEELKEVEVPQVLSEVHILGASLMNYSLENINEDNLINSEDPIEMLITLNKAQAVLAQVENLKEEMDAILDEYDIEFINFGTEEGGD